MASIKKKEGKHGTKYYVIYYYSDSNGNRKQKWESYDSLKNAQERKSELEYKKDTYEYVRPSSTTVKEFLELFVSSYGLEIWAFSTYDNNLGLIKHYINPTIGKEKIQDITPLFIKNYYQRLTKYKSVNKGTQEPRSKYLSSSTIRNIHKLLRCAFGFATEMEFIRDNPFAKVKAPKASYKKRESWTPELIQQALNACKDNRLFIAINLAFACSLRIGEVIGLTWDNVHIDQEDIDNGNAHIFVEKELQRASLDAINILKNDDIFHIFEPLMPKTTTRLILKTPKTESSIRKIWIPKTLAHILADWKQSQEHNEAFLGSEYKKYHGKDGRAYKFVVSLADGAPCEERIITKAFQKLIQKNGLPRVVFHSLRKSSATYKLKDSGGDIKAVQGDGGWAEPDMVTKTYSEILDEDRKVNAQRFDKSFYSSFMMRPPEPSQQILISNGTASTDVSAQLANNSLFDLMAILEQKPELLKALELVKEQPDIAKALLAFKNTQDNQN